MRKVVSFGQREQADRFVFFLKQKGITARTDFDLDPDGHFYDPKLGVRVWVEELGIKQLARELLQDFLELAPEELARQGFAASRAAAARRKADEQARQSSERIPVGSRLGDAPVSLVLIGSIALIFGTLQLSNAPDRLVQHFLFIPPLILRGEVWRALSPALTHQDFLHFLFNSIWMLQIAIPLEWNFGSSRMLRVSIGCALITHCVAYALTGPLFLGASGLLYCYVAYAATAQWCGSGVELDPGYRNAKLFLIFHLIGLALSLLLAPFTPLRLAHTIHATGAVVGTLAAAYSYLPLARFRQQLGSDPQLRRFLGLSALLWLLSCGFDLQAG